MNTLWYSNIAVGVKYDTHVHIYNEILYILVDSYSSKYGVMGIYILPRTLEYWATIAHDHIYDLIIMNYINSWLCYENPQDSSYTTSLVLFTTVLDTLAMALIPDWTEGNWLRVSGGGGPWRGWGDSASFDRGSCSSMGEGLVWVLPASVTADYSILVLFQFFNPFSFSFPFPSFSSSYSSQAQDSVSVYIRPICIQCPLYLSLFCRPWSGMTDRISLRESSSWLGLHNNAFCFLSLFC